MEESKKLINPYQGFPALAGREIPPSTEHIQEQQDPASVVARG